MAAKDTNMATTSSRRLGSDKEVAAVTFNLKEQRCLEKTMQTLDLEQSYARKLLELDQRIVRVTYKRLKDRVGKIKSYLKPEHIAELRTLEVDGKFKPQTTGVSLSSALKIASAARRLKLGQLNRSNTNIRFKINTDEQRNETPRPTLRKASSFTGIFVEDSGEPQREDSGPRYSVENKMRAQTSHGFRESRRNSRTPRAQTSHCIRSAFTSHSDKKNENEAQRQQMRKASVSSNVSDFGVNPYEERRQNLLSMENLKSKGLITKKETFVQAVDDYAEANPVPVSAISEKDADDVRQTAKFRTLEDRLIDLSNAKPCKKTEERAMSDSLVRRPSRRVAMIAENRKMAVSEVKVATYWQDITKCRYLSIPDNQLNMTGIITMLQKQDKLTEEINPVKAKSTLRTEATPSKNNLRTISPAISTKSLTKFVTYEV